MNGWPIGWAAILLTWVTLAFVYCGVGLLVRTIVLNAAGENERTLRGADFLDALWLGYCATVVALQFWHFAFPIGQSFGIALAIVALAGWIRDGRISRLLCVVRSVSPIILASGILLSAWVANRAMGPNNEIDSHLYHLQTLQWYKAYPIVPGLGNLHLPLAANSSSLLVAAWLDSGVWDGRANHVVNGFLITALFWHSLAGASRLVRRDAFAGGVFQLVAMVPAVQMANHWMVSSYSTDVAPACLSIVAAATLFRLASLSPAQVQIGDARKQSRFRTRRDNVAVETADRGAPQPGWLAFQTAALLGTAICCKLSAFAFGALGILFATGALARWNRNGLPIGRWLTAGAFFCVLAIGPWLSRGAILSGYPLYPSTFPAVTADWQVPKPLLEEEKFYQLMRNRLHHHYDWGDEAAIASLADWGWLRYWIKLQERDTVVPAILLVVGSVGLVFTRKRADRWHGSFDGLAVLLPALSAIVFWFLVQATQRMGFFLFWIAAATVLAELAGRRYRSSPRQVRSVVLVSAITLAVGNVKKPYEVPADGWGLHPPPPAPAMETFVTRWGIVLRRPVGGEPCCSDAPLPATPTPRSGLQLRRPGDLRHGFRLQAR